MVRGYGVESGAKWVLKKGRGGHLSPDESLLKTFFLPSPKSSDHRHSISQLLPETLKTKDQGRMLQAENDLMVGTPMSHQERGSQCGSQFQDQGTPFTHQIIFLTVHRAIDAVESLAAQSSP